MKNLFLFTLLFITSCSVMNKKHISVSVLEDKKFLLTKSDSLKFEKLKISSRKFIDSCNKYKLGCLIDEYEQPAEFAGGLNVFRYNFFENIVIPYNTKPSKNKIKIIIGTNNTIEKVETNSKDIRLKNEILRVLSLKELNKWNSAQLFGNKKRFSMTFYLNIKYNEK